MSERGGQPSILDVAALDGESTPDGVSCVNLDAQTSSSAAFAGGWLYATVERGTGPMFFPDDGWWPLWSYGDDIISNHADQVRILGAIAHRDVALPYHYDRRAPAGTKWNATTIYARGCVGGELVLPDYDIAFTPRHLRLVIFDGSTLHGVAPFNLEPDGYRLSLTFYLGEHDD